MEKNIILITKQHRYKFQIKCHKILNYLNIFVLGFWGEYCLTLSDILAHNKNLNKIYLSRNSIRIFKNMLIKILHILNFNWSSSFELIGYNFDLQKSLKKNIIKFNIGFSKFKILLYFNENLRIFGRKRFFTLFTTSIDSFFKIINFLLYLRNIFPYKKRGIVPSIIPSIWMKPGKKTKYK
jgi:hypothetical protein